MAPAEKIVKDLFALTKEDLVGFDVVLDAFGAWTPKRFRCIRARSNIFAIF